MTNEGLLIPDAEGDWEENINAIGTNIIDSFGNRKLRIAIRQDRKKLRDVWFATISFPH